MAHIEFHPENGSSPWVVRSGGLWLAYRTETEAKEHLPDVEFFEGEQWTPKQLEQMKAGT